MGQPQCAWQQVEDPADTQAASHVPQSAWWLLSLMMSPCGCTEEGAYPPVVPAPPSGTAVSGVRDFPRRLSRRADKGLRATSSVYSPLGDVRPEHLSTLPESLASAIFSRMVQGIMVKPHSHTRPGSPYPFPGSGGGVHQGVGSPFHHASSDPVSAKHHAEEASEAHPFGAFAAHVTKPLVPHLDSGGSKVVEGPVGHVAGSERGHPYTKVPGGDQGGGGRRYRRRGTRKRKHRGSKKRKYHGSKKRKYHGSKKRKYHGSKKRKHRGGG